MAKAEIKEVATEPAPYRMPEVAVSDVVLFYNEADVGSGGIPMVVTVLGAEAIEGYLLSLDTMHSRHSVRHIADPKLKEKPRIRSFGAWDYSPQGKLVREMRQAMQAAGLLDSPPVK